MKLYFCDLCNESVPHSDLEVGKAFIRKSRVVCASCDEAMSVALASQGGGDKDDSKGAAPAANAGGSVAQEKREALAREAVATRHAVPGKRSSASLGAAGLWIGVIALFVAAGTLMFTLQEMEVSRKAFADADEEVARESRRQLAEAQMQQTDDRSGLVAKYDALETRIDTQRQELLKMLQGAEAQLEEARQGAKALRDEITDLRDSVKKTTDLQDGQLRGFDAELERYDEEIRFFGERVNELEVRILTEDIIASAGNAAPKSDEGGSAAWSNILPDLASEESGERWNAVQALGETGDPGVVPHLIPILGDVDIFVRMATARVLGDLKAEAAVPHLIDALEDLEVAVQEAAVVSLRSITGRNFGFEIEANEKDRAKRIKAWRTWWKKSAEKSPPAGE